MKHEFCVAGRNTEAQGSHKTIMKRRGKCCSHHPHCLCEQRYTPAKTMCWGLFWEAELRIIHITSRDLESPCARRQLCSVTGNTPPQGNSSPQRYQRGRGSWHPWERRTDKQLCRLQAGAPSTASSVPAVSASPAWDLASHLWRPTELKLTYGQRQGNHPASLGHATGFGQLLCWILMK